MSQGPKEQAALLFRELARAVYEVLGMRWKDSSLKLMEVQEAREPVAAKVPVAVSDSSPLEGPGPGQRGAGAESSQPGMAGEEEWAPAFDPCDRWDLADGCVLLYMPGVREDPFMVLAAAFLEVLGARVDKGACPRVLQEARHRVAAACVAKHRRLLCDRSLPILERMRAVDSLVVSSYVFSAEVWRLTAKVLQDARTAHLQWLREAAGMRRRPGGLSQAQHMRA